MMQTVKINKVSTELLSITEDKLKYLEDNWLKNVDYFGLYFPHYNCLVTKSQWSTFGLELAGKSVGERKAK